MVDGTWRIASQGRSHDEQTPPKRKTPGGEALAAGRLCLCWFGSQKTKSSPCGTLFVTILYLAGAGSRAEPLFADFPVLSVGQERKQPPLNIWWSARSRLPERRRLCRPCEFSNSAACSSTPTARRRDSRLPLLLSRLAFAGRALSMRLAGF